MRRGATGLVLVMACAPSTSPPAETPRTRPRVHVEALPVATALGFSDWMTTLPDDALVAPQAGGLVPGAPSEEATVRTADLDGDGRQEVVVSVGSPFRPSLASPPRVFRLSSDARALVADQALTDAMARHAHIAGIVDVDGDGRWDVVQPTPAAMITFDALGPAPWATWTLPASIKQGEPFFEGTFGLAELPGVAGLSLLWPEPTCTAGLSVLVPDGPRRWRAAPERFASTPPPVRMDGAFAWGNRLQGVGMACDPAAPTMAYDLRAAPWATVSEGLAGEPPSSAQGPVAMAVGVDGGGAWTTWWWVGEHRARVLERAGDGWRDLLDGVQGMSPQPGGCNAMFQGGVPIDWDGDGALDWVVAQGDDHTSGCAARGIDLAMRAWRRVETGWRDVTEAIGLGGPVNAVSLYADDIDGDGDGDLIVSGMGHWPSLFRNNSPVPSLGVRVVRGEGLQPAVGAWLLADAQGVPPQARALGAATVRNATVMPWAGVAAPSGRVTRLVIEDGAGSRVTLRDVPAGQTITVRLPPRKMP